MDDGADVSGDCHEEPRFELLPTTFETRGSDPGWFFWLLAASLLGVWVCAGVLYVRWLAS